MATVNVWAFDDFTAYDQFTLAVFGMVKHASDNYDRSQKVKRIEMTGNTPSGKGLSLEAILVLIPAFIEVDAVTWAEFHNKIYRQDGKMRKGIKHVNLTVGTVFFRFEF